MTEIKTDSNASERPIKIQQRAFDVLFIMHTARPSAIQRPRINHNNLHLSVSLELLIED